MIVLAYILYLIWVFSMAKIEFYMFVDHKPGINNPKTHQSLALSRIPVLLMLFLMLFSYSGWFMALAGLASMLLQFCFWHDGILYQTYKNKGKGYPKGFFSDPDGASKAKINLTFSNRLIIFVIGISLAIFDLTIYFLNL